MEESTTARLLRQIKEACELAGARTEEYARISRKRLDVLSLGRELHKEKTALGERVYQLLGADAPGSVADDSTVQAILDRLRTLEGSLRNCEEEIGEIRESARSRVADVRRKYRPSSEEASGAAATGGPAQREATEAQPSGGTGAQAETPAAGEEKPAADRRPAEEPIAPPEPHDADAPGEPPGEKEQASDSKPPSA
ncbi:MAG: hypothetical protein GF330_12530 [Candidatus Eisenbacteria bacterium]|nr:hypothetical protein [Candidatus Eisenbacteria bacterium]